MEQIQLPLPSNLPKAENLNIDGRELAPNVHAIGVLHWNTDAARWQCLANVNGCLCVVEVKVTEDSHT